MINQKTMLLIALALLGSAINANGLEVSFPPNKVVVTGAAGRTGRLVFSSLNKNSNIQTLGLVRTEKSAKKLMKDIRCGLDQLVVCDVTDINDDIPKALEGANAMVICTSAVPYISKISLIKNFLKAPINLVTGKKPINFRNIRFKYRRGQHPEKVDYEGQVAQIDLAKKLGIEHVIIVSSMGGTDPNNFLNSIGKDKDGNGNGDILLWKRKAEKYLIESGLSYTIIHPGGLKDTPGSMQDLVLDVDDKLIKSTSRSISRADVANLCVAALMIGKGKNVSFDCIAKDAEEGAQVKRAEEALSEFLATGNTADYNI